MQTMSIADAQEKLSDLPRQVVSGHEEIVLTHSDGNMVLISLKEWESCKETLRLLNGRDAMRPLLESSEKRDRGLSSGKEMNLTTDSELSVSRNRTRLGCGKGTVRINADLTEPMIPENVWEMLKK